MICPCKTIEYNYVPPSGPNNARIYVIGLTPDKEDVIQKIPFISKPGQLLRSALTEAEINLETEVRFFNVVACKVVAENNPNLVRDPTTEELENCRNYVLNDIKLVNPEIILVMGKTAASAFVDVSQYKSVSELSKQEFEFEGIRLKVLWHPQYIYKNGGIGTLLYHGYVKQLRKFSKYQVSRYELNSLTILDSDKFLDWNPPSDHLGFDIETTSLDTLGEDFRVCGLGFSDLEGNGTYVYLKDEKDFTKIADKLRQIILNYTLYVFNFSFEGTAMATKLQVHPYQWKLVDARQTALVVAKKGSLKLIAQDMGFPDWESDNEWIIKCLTDLYKFVFTKKGKREKLPLTKLKESWENFVTLLESNEAYQNNLEKAILLEKTYSRPDSIITIEDLRHQFIKEADKRNDRLFFDLVPISIISRYCAFDAFAAIKMHNLLWDEMDSSEKKAFGYLNEHAELGAAISCTGVGWNVDKAIELDKFYQEEILKAMKGLLNNVLFRKVLELTTHDLVEINSSTDIVEIKKKFNPNSNHKTTREKFNFVMNQTFCKRVYTLMLLYNEVSMTSEDKFPDLKEKFVYLLRENKDPERMKIIRREKRNFILGDEENIRRIIRLYETEKKEFLGAAYLGMLFNIEIEHMDEATIVLLYDSFNQLGGIDVDDESTWVPEFEALHYFRTFKKVFKAYSTYLWGGIGMGEDARMIESSKSDLISPSRLNTDWKNFIRNNESMVGYKALASWRFNVNGADTNRWRSRYHLWPWQCELQDLKTSRYELGLIAHVDYSQMEVRTIAALAGEIALLEAYKSNKDVHKFMASKVFNKPEEEIDDTERRYSKMLTFSLLYGKTERGIARDFLGGDFKRARILVNGFFKGFPKIKKFVNQQHKLIDNDVRHIRSLFGERILMTVVGNPSKQGAEQGQLKRYSVNYPIQSSASHLAGLGINRAYKEAFQRNLPIKVFGFTHDAGDYDFDSYCLFDFLDIIYRRMELDIFTEFNIPVKIDMEVGVFGDNMMEFDIKERTKEKLVIDAKGSLQALKDIKSRLELAGINYDLENSSVKQEFMSRHFLYMKKRAFSAKLGKFQKIAKVRMNIYNPNVSNS
jgi:uracil-DNA glycosylase family 4